MRHLTKRQKRNDMMGRLALHSVAFLFDGIGALFMWELITAEYVLGDPVVLASGSMLPLLLGGVAHMVAFFMDR